MKSPMRTSTADNDINAVRSMGMVPEGYVVNNFLTDTDSYFLLTDVPNGLNNLLDHLSKLLWKVTSILVT